MPRDTDVIPPASIPFHINAVDEQGGSLECNEDFTGYPLRQSLALWLVLEIGWDKRVGLSKDMAKILSNLGTLQHTNDSRVVVHPDVVIFLQESLKTCINRPLSYCQNPRIQGRTLGRFQAEELTQLSEIKQICTLIFGDLSQYRFHDVFKEESTLLTLFKVAKIATLLSPLALERKAESCQRLRAHLIHFHTNRRDQEQWIKKLAAISREIYLAFYAPQLINAEFISCNRKMMIQALALVAKGLLVFDRKYLLSERNLIQTLFQRFAVTREEAQDFKKATQESIELIIKNVDSTYHFSMFAFLLACLISDQRLSASEYEFLSSIAGCCRFSSKEVSVLVMITRLETNTEFSFVQE